MTRRSRANSTLGASDADTRYARGAVPAALGARTGFFDPSRSVYNAKPANTAKLRRALANGLTGGTAAFLAIGDSETAGFGTNAGASISGANSWPGRLRDSLAAKGYTIAGTGWVFGNQNANAIGQGDSRLAFAGTWTASGLNTPFASSSVTGSTLTFTSDKAGTVAQILTLSNSRAFTFTVDGAAPANGSVTVAGGGTYSGGTVTPAGTSVLNTITVTGLSATTHVIVVTTTGATATYIVAVQVNNPSGISVHNMGIVGTSSPNWAEGNTSFFQTLSVSQKVAADVCFLSLMINDMRNSVIISRYKTDMQALISPQLTLNRDVVLVAPIPPSTSDTPRATYETFRNAMYDLADSNNLPVVDLAEVYQSWEAANALGMTYDGLHPNALGYAVGGAAIVNAFL